VAEERLKLAVFIDFDNIQIGVRDTLNKEFDVSLVLEALKERGEVVAKIAYADWARAGDQSRQMTQHAIQMVQRSVTPRGDKNGADINLALDALEMAFTRHHVNAFAIVGGDSDFMALVEKLKQFDKRVFVIGGRSFTSGILQRNCTEFIAYENLLKSAASDGPRARAPRRSEAQARPAATSAQEVRPLADALPNIQRALKILADRGVAPQLGLLKSTLLQLDSTFSERDYGAGSFLEFMQKIEGGGLAHLRRTERGFLVEPLEVEDAGTGVKEAAPAIAEGIATTAAAEVEAEADLGNEAEAAPVAAVEAPAAEALNLLRQALAAATLKNPSKPLYIRQLLQAVRVLNRDFDERRYGFRGALDMLHQAQREGLLKLQRDHKGVWRIHALAATPEPAAEPEPAPEHTVQDVVAEPASHPPQVETSGEAEETEPEWTLADEHFALKEPEAVAADPEPVETAPAAVVEEPGKPRKTRKTRVARPPRRSAARTTAAKTPRRRKTKEPVAE
jgi:uncharacterized protein (TIGR00288 family)